MENSYGFVVEPHVAQQSRRDKLRASHNLDDHLARIQGFRSTNGVFPMFNDAMIDFSRGHEDAGAASSFDDHSWVVNHQIGFQPIYQNVLPEDLGMMHNFTEIKQPQEGDRGFYESCGWVGELGSIARKTEEDEQLRSTFSFMADSNNNPQGLALSLSSNPSVKLPADAARFVHEPEGLQDSVRHHNIKGESLCRLPKPSSSVVGGRSCGKSLQDVMGNPYRNTGPLGPFTGYATILKNSKFLRPAQLLLDEFCGASGQKFVEPCEVFEKTSDEALNAEFINDHVVVNANSSGAETSNFCCSNETNVSGVGSISSDTHQPEYQQKKAKLIYMLEEVCRRYKQYHQQMQMVVSSFESVAGLSSATPYISLALKTVSRHFRGLKTAISDQLKYLRKALGEDLPSPSAGMSGGKGDLSSVQLRYNNMEQSSCFQKQKSGLVNMGYIEPQHVWRPQRGLPERAVAILRAWLFEHFLHPYPTDTDKHMLATQTGLTRNQVSNWFINARVRVWKPMVEEIHMLETKALTETNKGHATNEDGTCTIIEKTNAASWSSSSEQQNPLKSHDVANEIAANQQFQCLGADSASGNHRSSLGGDPKLGMDGQLMGFMPYRPSGVEVGGLGAVSLTLGLRRVESAHQQQQQRRQLQPQDDQLVRHFGGEMIHDFVG